MMASIFCSVISRRAFSRRERRSSAVIGLASARIDVSAAMLAGTGPAGASPPRPRWADSGVTVSPADAPVSQRNDRRDSMDISFNTDRETETETETEAEGYGGHGFNTEERNNREQNREE